MIHGEPQSIGEVFLGQLRNRPDSTALFLPHDGKLQSFSWRDLAQLVSDALEQFEQRGIDAGSHIATWLPNGLAWIVIDLACQLRGAVHVALDARLPASAMLRWAEHAEAQMLVASEERLPELTRTGRQCALASLGFDTFIDREALGSRHTSQLTGPLVTLQNFDAGKLERPANLPARADAVAQILYTSGTMSQPKGVMLSHRNLLSNARAKLAAAPQHANDVRLNVLPFSHAYARTCELSTWIISGSQLCIARDWSAFLELAPRVRPTLVNLVPHLAQKLVAALDTVADLACSERAGKHLLGDRLRLLQVGGAALPPAVWDRLAGEGWPPLQGYGLTEASPVICSNRAGDQRCDSVGRSVPGVELRTDECGILWTRGPHVMLGYWKEPTETAAKIKDGWLCTGDLAEVTEDGRWRIIGRADDQITLSTGYKASPHELTRRLAHDPWVDQLVIVGQDRPHLAALVYPRWEELPAELFESSEEFVKQHPAKSLPEDEFADRWQRLSTTRFARALAERWSTALADLPRQLRIERIGLLPERLASESGGLNFKGSVRRKFVEQVLLVDHIAELYRDSQSVAF